MKGKKRIRGIALLLVVLTMSCLLGSVALAVEATVVKAVNMREGAGTDYKSILKLKKGATVTVLESPSGEEWWKISYQEQEGYVSSEYLEIVMPPAEPGYATRNTQIREGKGTSGKVLVAVPIYAQISVIDRSESTWWKVMYENQEGYVQASAVKLGEPPAGASSSSSAGTVSVSANDPNASKITKAKSINKDTVGWIDVPNTNIDDPILYGANFYYNDRNIHKKKSLEGVYPYVNRLTRNVVIFGHNLRGSNKGFHQLHHLQEAAVGRSSCQYGSCGRGISSLKNWHTSESGRVWNISIFGKSKWEVFAMYEVPRNEPISTLRSNWSTSPANLGKWSEKQVARSEIDFGVSVSEKDNIMTIITCGTNYDSATANSRLFVFLKNVG